MQLESERKFAHSAKYLYNSLRDHIFTDQSKYEIIDRTPNETKASLNHALLDYNSWIDSRIAILFAVLWIINPRKWTESTTNIKYQQASNTNKNQSSQSAIKSDGNNKTLVQPHIKANSESQIICKLTLGNSSALNISRYRNFLILCLAISQHAQTCHCFDPYGWFNNNYFSMGDNPHQLPNNNNFNLNQNSRYNYRRSLTSPNNNLGPFMSPSSLNDDVTPTGTANGWTSILPSASNRPIDTLDEHIRNILVPRVSGTPGNVKVRDYIINSLSVNNYDIELDEFTQSTPVGPIKFANVIASSNPDACRQLVLACHYDSKKMDGFLGAVDSAVPCAMLLKMSETFKNSFRGDDGQPDERNKIQLGLRFIFFDGEEAFVQWTKNDSLYGSRHLAEKWEKQSLPEHCKSLGSNELARIEIFVLLDLIGSSDTHFVMYNRKLKSHYDAMQGYEKSYMSRNGLTGSSSTAFKNRFLPLNLIEDDHVPFRDRGVPILSLLAHPFPSVWHTVDDNYNAIDFPRTRRILHVIEEFVTNYTRK